MGDLGGLFPPESIEETQELTKWRKSWAGTTMQDKLGHRAWSSHPQCLLWLSPPLTVPPHPVHPLWYLLFTVHVVLWLVVSGETLDLAFIAGFG